MGMLLFAGLKPQLRSNVNSNDINVFEYAFIDHMKQADNMIGPIGGAGWDTATKPYNQTLDSNGWPADTVANGKSFGCGPRIPAHTSFAGPYVATWDGDGTVWLSAAGVTFTETNNTGATYTKNSNGNWSTVAGQKAKVIFNVSGTTGPTLLNIQVTATGGSDGFVKNLQLYRQEDESDLLAGKIFRTGFKQLYVDWNPERIRFMDWLSTNASSNYRFENRNLPTDASWMFQWGHKGPRYGDTSGTNQFTLLSATGMPVSMTHGEQVFCRIGSSSGLARCTGDDGSGGTTNAGGGGVAIASIDKTTNTVTTTNNHPFSTNDIIVHQMMSNIPGQVPSGMVEFNNLPVKITVTGLKTYTVTNKDGSALNMTGFSAFTVGTAYQYTTLNVGGRGEYPIVFNDGASTGSRFGNSVLSSGKLKCFIFDKNIVASTLVTGAWVLNRQGIGNFDNAIPCGIPIEVCVAFINELMAMNPKNPINMYVCIPHIGMISSDPDYASASNWPVNMVDVILNPSSTVRTPGYSALDSRCTLYIEHSNETWNPGMDHCLYMRTQGLKTWPALGSGDQDTFSTVRAVKSIREIKTAFAGNSSILGRIQFVLGMWGTYGYSGGNVVRFDGNSQYTAAVDSSAPMTNFDYCTFAAYVYNDDSVSSRSLSQCTSDWLAAGSDAAKQEVVYANYVSGIQGSGGLPQESESYYLAKNNEFLTRAAFYGKKVTMYEGGWDHVVSGGTLTTDNSNFLKACKRSQSWATALVNFHRQLGEAGTESPADYIMVSERWGHCDPDTYSGTTEGGALDLAWLALKARNKS